MSKTISTLNPRVRGFVEWRLEHYREDKRALGEYRAQLMPSNTPRYSLTPGGGSDTGRPTEEIAARLAMNPYILELERAIDAIDHVLTRLPADKMRLVDLVYFRGTHTVSGAGEALHLSRRTAYRYVNEVLTAIAAELGYTSV